MTRIVTEIRPEESSGSIRSTIKVVRGLGDDNPANAETIANLEAKLKDAEDKEASLRALEYHYKELWDSTADFVIDNHRYAATHINAREGLGKQLTEKLVEMGWNPPVHLSALSVTVPADIDDEAQARLERNPDAIEAIIEGDKDQPGIPLPPIVGGGSQFNTLDDADN